MNIKAIIPAAGFGTRMLPLAKSVPKEMLPLVNKPVIQYVVEEAIDAGINEILIVLSKGKEAIKEHFSHNDKFENKIRIFLSFQILIIEHYLLLTLEISSY